MPYCTFKADKRKRLDVESQINIRFFPGKLLSVNSVQKLNFSMSLCIAKSYIFFFFLMVWNKSCIILIFEYQ